METIRKIAIVGPESTGKTTLAKALATHFNTVYVPEYAREYLEQKGEKYRYSYDDLEKIAKGQLEREREAEKKAKKYLFCDTEFLVLKIWSLYVFGKVSPFILKYLESHRYDLYLLTNNDVEWEADPLRESTGTAYREKIFSIYKHELNNLGFPYKIVKGIDDKRFQNAVEIIQQCEK